MFEKIGIASNEVKVLQEATTCKNEENIASLLAEFIA